MCRIILASGSPRRKQLLSQLGLEYDVVVSDMEEHAISQKPEQIVKELAKQKAKAIMNKIKEEQYIIIGADTVVAYENTVLGKPKTKKDAKKMLEMLSGKTHSVYTGVALLMVHQNEIVKEKTFYEETKVTMRAYSSSVIDEYIATKEQMDKAGSYGIQGKGAILVDYIQGDYNNVVGLPLAKTYWEIRKLQAHMK